MLAQRYRGWPAVSYVVVSIPLNKSYNYSLVVHEHGVVHGRLAAVS